VVLGVIGVLPGNFYKLVPVYINKLHVLLSPDFLSIGFTLLLIDGYSSYKNYREKSTVMSYIFHQIYPSALSLHVNVINIISPYYINHKSLEFSPEDSLISLINGMDDIEVNYPSLFEGANDLLTRSEYFTKSESYFNHIVNLINPFLPFSVDDEVVLLFLEFQKNFSKLNVKPTIIDLSKTIHPILALGTSTSDYQNYLKNLLKLFQLAKEYDTHKQQ
jgi:hypothetical protein